MRARRRRLTLGVALGVLGALGGPAASAPAQAPADLLIRNVRVVHGDGRVTRLADVAVRGGLIDAVEPLPAPVRGPARLAARRVIHGDGLTLLPGFIDAHVHGAPWMWAAFLDAGITTVRDLGNDGAFIFPLAQEPAADRPRIVASGPAIDARGDPANHVIEASSVGEVRAAARGLIAAGARVILAAPRMEPALLSVLVSEARARGIPVAAILGVTTAAQAAELGVSSIEQLSGIVQSVSPDAGRFVRAHEAGGGRAMALSEWRNIPLQRLEILARELAARGVVLVPTLAAHEADAKHAQALPILQQFVGIFVRVGGRVATGTGAGLPSVTPGLGLHRELELLVSSGLSPAAAISTATADAAALLAIQDRVGTIDAGKAADMVLVTGDPLLDIRATRKIGAVIKGGTPVNLR